MKIAKLLMKMSKINSTRNLKENLPQLDLTKHQVLELRTIHLPGYREEPAERAERVSKAAQRWT